ncbi:hypothetical protein [Gimesia maris]|uniref:hypothetical protein n=1 Tax=Gimesia maris TaxID=122 RepID=UPI00241FEBC2|nr:hypothetical protein [Gimesia maris]|tara:strand:- start:35514 stop:36053 length:540 start_codon:yes stop_codon:yes gene_type:complete
MGQSDFQDENSEGVPEDDGPSPHYVLAHYALRQIALAEPMQFLEIAASPDADKFIAALLQQVVKQCGREAGFDASEIKVYPTRVNNYPCAVIEMPEPQEAAEAWLVGVVVPVDFSVKVPADLDLDQITAQYYTLEKGVSLTGEPRTVLAGWDDQRHNNYGDGPEPTVEAFVAALCGQDG